MSSKAQGNIKLVLELSQNHDNCVKLHCSARESSQSLVYFFWLLDHRGCVDDCSSIHFSLPEIISLKREERNIYVIIQFEG
jgi:hypothetical protein